MRSTRSILLAVSVLVVVLLLGGGLAVKVGAAENSYHQVVVFSEILSLVIDNYVDPVEADKLLAGAFEGMLGGLDANGAYLTPEEAQAWKDEVRGPAHPGISVLKAGSSLQVVALDAGSPAEASGVEVGDHIRSIDGQSVRDLSLSQAWRLIQGDPGTTVKFDLLHPADGFRREEIEVRRTSDTGRTYELDVERGIAVLRIYDMGRLSAAELASELDDVRSRGVDNLLLDLRNLADLHPRDAVVVGGLFSSGPLLRLRDRSGRLLESLESTRDGESWVGSIAVLVNGATAGSSEALASLVKSDRGGLVLGETTYGLGAEPKLYELEDGSGLLVSSALWETVSGEQWNATGVEPDHVIRGTGNDLDARAADQLERALDLLWQRERDGSDARTAT